MNRLTFEIDNSESIKKCYYEEDIFSLNNEKEEIILPRKALNKIFQICQSKFKTYSEEKESNEKNNNEKEFLKFTFYEIDVQLIDFLFNLSRHYISKHTENSYDEIKDIYEVLASKRNINTFESNDVSYSDKYTNDSYNRELANVEDNQESYVEDSIIEKDLKRNKKKLVRTNKFNKTFIIKISSVLLILLTLYSSFAIKNDIGNPIIMDIMDKLSSNNNYYSETIEENMSQDIPIAIFHNVDKTSSNEYINTCNKFYDVIEKFANMYGISPELIVAMASYNGGIHSSAYDYDGNIGLLKINKNYLGQEIRGYNFDTQEYEEVLIVNDAYLKLYGDRVDYNKVVCNIDLVDDNIKAGCIIFQNELYDSKLRNNIIMGIMAHDVGVSKVAQIVRYCSDVSGCKYDNLFKQNNLQWLIYRSKLIKNRQSNYLERVLSYVPDNTTIYVRRPDGSIDSFIYDNSNVKTLGYTK